MFQPIYRFVKKIGNTNLISTQKSNGFSDESIKIPATSDKCLAPSLNHTGVRSRIICWPFFKTR